MAVRDRFKLTEGTLATKCIPPTDKPQAYYWCKERKGFGVVVGRTGRKTFAVRGRANGRLVKITIGTAGAPRDSDGHTWTVQLAWIEAKKLLGTMASGKAPPKRQTGSGPTLRDALEYHVAKMERGENRRRKACSPRSIATLRSGIELHLAEYLDRPIVDVTAAVLRRVVTRIERETPRRADSNPANPPGRALTNRLLANVSAVWRSYRPRLPLCPVDWGKDGGGEGDDGVMPAALAARDNRIGNHELPAWHAKVMAMGNHVRRDLQLVALYTGVRTEGVRTLRWEDVDFEDELVTIQRAKGDRPYTVPMVASVREVLERRQRDNAAYVRDVLCADGYGDDQGYVFPSLARDGKTVQAIAEPKERAVVRGKDGKAKKDEDGNLIRETYLPGIQACRKTFNSVAIEIGVPREIRERLMNHEGRGVNVKSYGFPHDWQLSREWADKIEAALNERIAGKVMRKPRHLKAVK